jgi:hypothetical protein
MRRTQKKSSKRARRDSMSALSAHSNVDAP